MRDPEQTRTAILDAAEGEFLAKGFGGASLADIAQRADVTKSLIHHHFGSKEALWGAVKERKFSEYFELQMRLLEESEPTEELLRQSIQAYFRHLQKHPELIRLLTWMALEGDTVVVDQAVRLNRAGVEKIRQAQEAGDLRDDMDPAFILASFLGLAEHWFLHRQGLEACLHMEFPTSDDTSDAYLDAMTKVFFEGIRKR
jgi:TetR/AcrR family transcriptional regulator